MSDHSVFEMFKSLDHAEHLYKEVSARTKTDEERDISFLLSLLVNTEIESLLVQMTVSDLHDALLFHGYPADAPVGAMQARTLLAAPALGLRTGSGACPSKF